MSTTIELVPYDPDWPRVFAAERARLLQSTVLEQVEHVGSTAVPGLTAKPTVDLMGGVRALSAVDRAIGDFVALGYDYVTEFEDVMPERRYFRRPAERPRTHHLHVVEIGSPFWERHLAFRDWLRTHPEDAEAYAELKRQLAAVHGTDFMGYTDAKTAFIRRLEAVALRVRLGD